MQNTAVEWQQSSANLRACATCHMPTVVGGNGEPHRDHRFRIREQTTLAKAVAVSWDRQSELLRVTIENRGAGHALPTGDIFRRLVVRAYAVVNASTQELLPKQYELGRRFLDVPTHPHAKAPSSLQRVEIEDTRLGPMGTPRATRVLTLPIPPSRRALPIHCQLVYQRMSPSMARYFDIHLADEEIVLSDWIAAPQKDPT
jgi:hypothetical protein